MIDTIVSVEITSLVVIQIERLSSYTIETWFRIDTGGTKVPETVVPEYHWLHSRSSCPKGPYPRSGVLKSRVNLLDQNNGCSFDINIVDII